MSHVADWYFDPISPYAYLQFAEMDRLPDSVEVRFRPVLFAGLLNHWGQLGPAEIPEKKRQTMMLTRWRAEQRGLRLVGPPRHPFNPLALLRLSVALGSTREVVGQILSHIWADGEDGQDPESLDRLCEKLGVQDRETVIADPEVKATLRRNTEEAVARGVFGVPTFVVGEHVFWGDDMFDLMLAWLDRPEILEHAELARLLQMPPAAERPRGSTPTDAAQQAPR